MLIKDIMTKEVYTIKLNDTVEDCARLFTEKNLSGAPVVDDDGNLKGIVTEGDLIRRGTNIKGPKAIEILGGLIYLDTPKRFFEELKKDLGIFVQDVMTDEVITINENATVEEAATLMVEKKVKRLPVLDDQNRLVGIISRKDIMNYLFPKGSE
ncbi:MAG: CBS domain-containing protein [Tissierellales bacterium]|nr:CBS domain-containing protein [Tissierellales bacterium]